MIGYTDIHSHFLYGLDDGPKTKEEMEAMLDAAYADGITTLFATPHVTPGLSQLDTKLMNQHLNEAREYCEAKKYQLNLFSGAEILFAPTLEPLAKERRIPTLADTSFVLVEFVPDISYSEVEAAIDILAHSNYNTILAHIERYNCLFASHNAYRLKEKYDIYYQINCNSILKGRGWLKNYYLRKWLDNEIIDFVATDSHDTKYRPTQMDLTYTALLKRHRKEYVDKLVRQQIE